MLEEFIYKDKGSFVLDIYENIFLFLMILIFGEEVVIIRLLLNLLLFLIIVLVLGCFVKEDKVIK